MSTASTDVLTKVFEILNTNGVEENGESSGFLTLKDLDEGDAEAQRRGKKDPVASSSDPFGTPAGAKSRRGREDCETDAAIARTTSSHL